MGRKWKMILVCEDINIRTMLFLKRRILSDRPGVPWSVSS